jgi:hypothetical protein
MTRRSSTRADRVWRRLGFEVLVLLCASHGSDPQGGEVFVFRWGDVAEGAVEAVVVEPTEVLDDGELELVAGASDAVWDRLGLEAVDEALGERVVVGVPDRAHGRAAPVVGERLGIFGLGVLPAVWMVHQCDVGARLAGPERIREAWRTKSVRMCEANCQPTTRRL